MFKSFGHSTCIHPVKKDQDKSGDASVCVFGKKSNPNRIIYLDQDF